MKDKNTLKKGQITIDLNSWMDGDQQAGLRVFEIAYERLISIASYQRKKVGNVTISPTEVVHEAYSRLVKATKNSTPKNSLEFYRLSAHVFKLTCIDYLRVKLSLKHNSRGINLEMTKYNSDDVNLLQILILLEDFEAKFVRQSLVFQLNKIMGFSLDETAKMTNSSKATVSRDLNFARHWLVSKLE